MSAALRVMTFNVRGARFEDGVNIWPVRAGFNVSVIRQAAPDLLGLQECELANLEFYRLHLPNYEQLPGPNYGNRPPFEYPAVLWNPERLTLLTNGAFWLSPTPDRRSGGWGTSWMRSAQWLHLRINASGQELIYLNTHLDHISDEARSAATRLIIERLTAIADGLPQVVTADFNCTPDSGTYKLWRNSGFRDAYLEAGHAETPQAFTYHGFQGRAFAVHERPEGARIDWVLLRDGETPGIVQSCVIRDDGAPPIFPSDHYPVVADIAW
jgi:endonuclease/exonuclease/phosphatase family metal-dependent hydrolase